MADRMSLRARLVVLTVVLAVIGLTVSDALVLSTVRGQLEHRVDQQLLRFGQRFVDGPMPGRLLGGQPHSGSVFLPSQYVLTTFSPDGSYAPLLRSPVTAGDPQPQLPRLSPAQLRQRLARPFTVPADHGGGSWRVLLLAAAGSDPDNAGSASSTAAAWSWRPRWTTPTPRSAGSRTASSGSDWPSSPPWPLPVGSRSGRGCARCGGSGPRPRRSRTGCRCPTACRRRRGARRSAASPGR
ncbi:hypothetical protein ACFQZC_19685 [Streptacidiphilus monticola]